jgi:hypothetical protein
MKPLLEMPALFDTHSQKEKHAPGFKPLSGQVTLPVGRNTSGEKAIAFTHLQERNPQALKNATTCLPPVI